ncbi:Glycosyltransferase, GT2 family [Desulforamulus putei DSM 12395]|uniref:Glycosyltransferase, GT2 family n=1 Tax=Desulforamulus putei DSM 12395 TaxID=1121429 RepID=A0A1M4VJ95_9FIRM|nr:glycosyltransferase [Desulforamulus putei]SHE69054.1 Glycosyltransferase, GT2 family [Desulforamulus putei DSM 12395]
MVEKSSNIEINSKDYWQYRFQTDWEINQGRKQSRFFSYIALKHLPTWLIQYVKKEKLSICDWGCALGDGTNELAEFFNSNYVTGIDFSEKAIEKAQSTYQNCKFLCMDFIANNEGPTYDIVFSSNTLEHFEDYLYVLSRIQERAKKFLILLLPFREYERIAEHFTTFDFNNISINLINGWHLVHSVIIDAKEESNSYWPGEQILLVYAHTGILKSLKLTLADIFIISKVMNERVLVERDGQIASLNQAVAELDRQIASLNQEVAERDEQISSLNQAIAERDKHIASLNQAVVERDAATERLRQEMMRLSDWAAHIDANPVSHALRKHLYKLARYVYRSLPLSMGVKQRLKKTAMAMLHPFRSSSNRSADRQEMMTVQISGQRILAQADQTQERDIFVFSIIDWNFRFQRPQHFARSLAKMGRRVFFFSNHFIDTDKPGYQIEQLDPSLSLYQIKLHVKGAPAIYFAPPTSDAEKMLEEGIAQFILDFGASSIVALIQHAYWYPVVQRIPNSIRVYDCMDHHEGFGNVPKKLIEIEKDMLRQADLVVVSSAWLEDFARPFNTNICLVRNACEYDHFANEPYEVYKDRNGRKIIGYYGAIAEWFDVDLIQKVAIAYPDCLILLIGNDTIGAKSFLGSLPNVLFTGEVPYARLPFYLHAFDVCLLPFKVLSLTLATNPVKVYEYLAAGKSVVCVDLPEMEQFGNLVLRAQSADEFIHLVGQALVSNSGTEEEVRARKDFALQQTWDQRVAVLCDVFDNINMPKISVIVLTYNNLELTRACLQSLVYQTDYPNLEIIVVDNNSVDGTRDYLEEFRHKHPEVRLILNDKNLGFAAGNNVGLAAATGEYLVILNNDTVVTRGWAITLMRHLQDDPTIGLIGPVTNNIGNEQRIETTYQDMSQMSEEAFCYTLTHMGKIIPIRTLAFFCVMMPRSTYEKCGPLCEDYGIGFFEDDDYCRRVEAAGLRIVCAEDVFIHHHLSASFNMLKSEEKMELFEKNKMIYEKKWGAWIPHQYRQ